uniref:Regulatory protein zeste n=1 Tax=Cacopsylla melanoneura TaxID=428564 RepID=A0A8D8Q8E9_9HEMI
MTSRKRSANFCDEDKGLLIGSIKEHFDIIQSTRTNKVFRTAKDNCWDQITTNYNANSQYNRDAKQLKIFYENWKRKLRKVMKDQDTLADGFIEELDQIDLQLLELLKSQVGSSTDNPSESDDTLSMKEELVNKNSLSTNIKTSHGEPNEKNTEDCQDQNDQNLAITEDFDIKTSPVMTDNVSFYTVTFVPKPDNISSSTPRKILPKPPDDTTNTPSELIAKSLDTPIPQPCQNEVNQTQEKEDSTELSMKRQTNFSNKDKKILIVVLEKYLNTIENKSLNRETSKEKEDCWNLITTEYNERSQSTRHVRDIHHFYDSWKRRIKLVEKQQARGDYSGGLLDNVDLELLHMLNFQSLDVPLDSVETLLVEDFDNDSFSVSSSDTSINTDLKTSQQFDHNEHSSKSESSRSHKGKNKSTRLRHPNFSLEEKALLISPIRQHFDTLESKLNNKFIRKEKDEIWESIAAKFNVNSSCKRDIKQLRGFYENWKRRLKKYNEIKDSIPIYDYIDDVDLELFKIMGFQDVTTPTRKAKKKTTSVKKEFKGEIKTPVGKDDFKSLKKEIETLARLKAEVHAETVKLEQQARREKHELEMAQLKEKHRMSMQLLKYQYANEVLQNKILLEKTNSQPETDEADQIPITDA